MSDFEIPGEAYFVKVHKEARAPVYKSRLAACADLTTCVPITLRPREFDRIPMGIILIPPQGWHFHVYMRSSLPFKFPGIVLANCTGIIDSDYIGPKDELHLTFLNHSADATINIPAGTRIAQARLVRNAKPSEFKELTYEQVQARRSRGGFGSTG